MAGLADFLEALLRGEPVAAPAGAPMNAASPIQAQLAQAASDQGTAGPVGSGAYANALQAAFQPSPAPSPAPSNTSLLGVGRPAFRTGTPMATAGTTTNPMAGGNNVVASNNPNAGPAPAASPSYGYSARGTGGGISGVFQSLRDIFDPQARDKNITFGWLQKQGMDAGTASLLTSNKDLLRGYLSARMQGQKPDLQVQSIYDDKGNEQKVLMDMRSGQYRRLGGAKPNKESKPSFGPIGQDEYGNTTYGWRDPNTQKVTPAGGPSVDGSTASGAYDNGTAAMLHGDDYLKTLPPTIADQVKAYASGKMPMPSGYALKSPYFQKMMQMVTQYDPSFDAVNYNARSKTRNDFTSGKSAQSINALNTVIGHLGTLSAAADKLDNSTFPTWNAVKNVYENATGDPRIKNFDTTKKAVVDELTRVWRGSGGSEGDIKTWSDQINASNSPAQLHSVIGQIGDLLESKINALAETYKQGMGTTADPIQFVTPKSQITLDALRSSGSPPLPDDSGPSRVRNPATPGANAPVRAVNPRTGARIELQNGKWVPVQ
jgi:hypothetical protein